MYVLQESLNSTWEAAVSPCSLRSARPAEFTHGIDGSVANFGGLDPKQMDTGP